MVNISKKESIECGSCTNTDQQVKNLNANTSGRMKFAVSGMDCADEVAILKKEVGPLAGGSENLAFDVLNAHMTILNDNVDELEIIKAVARTGMKATRISSDKPATDPGVVYRRKTVITTSVSGFMLFIGFLYHSWIAGGFIEALGYQEGGSESIPITIVTLYATAIIVGGWFIFPKAFFSLKRMRPDINLLMTVAVIGAVIIGEWFEAAAVTFLFALSLALESWSVGRARRAVAALMELAPETARIRKEDGTEHEILAEEVPVGATIIVLGGERIPLDGEVSQGHSLVNQAPITGESMPVEKSDGSTVYAGTINGDGTLEITTTKEASATTLENIIRLVGEAQSKRAPSEQWVEKFARIYTPVVMVLALAVFIVPISFGLPWEVWFYRALVLLVIACPCALVISTPVSVVASLAAAARAGVLVKGGMYLEIPARLKAIAMDKTGTITEGKPAVIKIIPLSEHSEEELLERAVALEARSTHPLALAILNYAETKEIKTIKADDVKIIPGKGVVGGFKGKPFWLGSPRYLREQGLDVTEETKNAIDELSGKGGTVIAIGNDEHVCGLIAVADSIRPQAVESIKKLQQIGIEHIIMLTGDNKLTAETIAAQAGLNEFRAELLPEDKVNAIAGLVEEYGNVGMIGDGVNDAPAMGRASIGIAMGAIGSDAAIESADIALMADDLSRLPWLILHSRNTLSIIKQNIWLSLVTKAVFLILGVMGVASLWMAIAADMGTTLVVIANGLRLLRSEKAYA